MITEGVAASLRYQRDALAERLDIRTVERDEARQQYEESARRVANLEAGMDTTAEMLQNALRLLLAAQAENAELRKLLDL